MPALGEARALDGELLEALAALGWGVLLGEFFARRLATMPAAPLLRLRDVVPPSEGGPPAIKAQ